MKAHALEPYLLPIALRQHKLMERRVLGLVFGLAALIGIGLFAAGTTWGIAAAWFASTIALALFATRFCAQRAFNYGAIARRIETEHPELKSLLITAMEQAPESGPVRFNYLQERVIEEAINKAVQQNWIHTVSDRMLKQARGFELVAGAAFAILFLLLAKGLIESSIYASHALAKSPPVEAAPTPLYPVDVSPGDVAVEAGDRLVIRARFDEAIPADVVLMAGLNRGSLQAMPMKKNLEDPIFGGIIPAVNQAMVYRVDFEGHQSDTFAVSVFRYPELERADMIIQPPSYSKLPEETVEDTRYINVLEQSTVQFQLILNKSVATAQLIPDEGETVDLQANPASPRMVQVSIVPDKTMSYRLKLVDEAGRENRKPVELLVKVRKNQPPEMKFVFPRKDSTVSPLQEMLVEGEVYDDLGLLDYGMVFTLSGKNEEITLSAKETETGRQTFQHLLELEAMQVEPNEFVAYHIWAEDLGPRGRVRRSVSDMFFAEVRHFEEIYREQQAPPSESEEEQEQAPKADELLKQQKEIISATWNMKRVVDTEGDLAGYTNDVAVVRDAQQNLASQASEVSAMVDDEETREHLLEAINQMQEAVATLDTLLENQDRSQFAEAMSREQAAYAALIKMRGREYQVMRAQQSKSKSSKSQQQSQRPEINELELKQQERLYETEREAKKEQQTREEEEQRENLQVLNRLRELARRQDEIKEKLQEVKHALELAQDEAEKERLRRELKRLEEQQKDLLSDVDELRQRMDQEENRERMAEAKQEVNDIRKDVQETKEQIEQEEIDDAVNSSARAQEKLDKLREDFRKQAAGRFDEEMRDMRQEARQLAAEQEELKEALTQAETAQEAKPKRLDDSPDEGDKMGERLDQQRSDAEQLVQKMIDVSREAETAEPLLSRRLHDTVREARSNELESELARTADYLRFDRDEEAKESIGKTSEAMNDLKEGIEKAAETVLGDEATALRKAKNELEDVIDQLNREIQQAQGGVATNQSAQARATGEPGQENDPTTQAPKDPGEPSGQEPQTGEGEQPEGPQPQPGEGQQPQPGEEQQPQPGEGQQPQPGEGQQPQPGEGQQPQPGEGQQPQPGEGQQPQPGEGQQPQPGEGQQPQPGEGQQPQPGEGQQPQPSEGQQPQPGEGQQPQPGEGQQPQPGEGQQSPPTPAGPNNPQGGFQDHTRGPITGTEFKKWSDQLRDVEEMLDTPELRNEAARIRDRAKTERAAFRRHSKDPEWEVVQDKILKPLVELQQRVEEELAKMENEDALVPIDRDPVPRKFEDLVRRYYQKLGEGD